MSRFSEAFAINVNVIRALILRESRMAFGSSHWGYLWAIMQPAVTLTFLIVVFVLIGRGAPFGESLPLFFATSILCLEFFSKTSTSLMRAFSSNAALFAYPPVKKADALLARFLLVASVHTLVWAAFYTGLVLTGYAMVPHRPEYVMGAFIIIGLIGYSIGMINAVIFSVFSSWQHFEKLYGRPLFFLSGTFYVPSMLPPEAVRFLEWNPILHAVELCRMGFYGNYHSEVFSASFVIETILILVTSAMFIERFSRKKRK